MRSSSARRGAASLMLKMTAFGVSMSMIELSNGTGTLDDEHLVAHRIPSQRRQRPIAEAVRLDRNLGSRS